MMWMVCNIDDYFYPYPDVVGGRPKVAFPDGLSPGKAKGAY